MLADPCFAPVLKVWFFVRRCLCFNDAERFIFGGLDLTALDGQADEKGLELLPIVITRQGVELFLNLLFGCDDVCYAVLKHAIQHEGCTCLLIRGGDCRTVRYGHFLPFAYLIRQRAVFYFCDITLNRNDVPGILRNRR
jgi:hypothetical protein